MMDTITIFSALIRWGVLALVGSIILILLFATAYYIYKKVFHGKRTLRKKQWGLLYLISCWFLLVMALTTLSRGENYTGSINIDFFSGYLNAWNKWSVTELQLIIFNILMFVPLGFLLPLIWKKSEKFHITAIASLTVTVCIEVTQLLTGRGILEFDDLLHNFIGSLFGYFCIMAFLHCKREKKLSLIPVLKIFLIPCVVGSIISIAVIAYQAKPYGNMPILPAVKQDMSKIEVITDLTLSDDASTASIYKNSYVDKQEHMQQIIGQISNIENITFSNSVRREGENRIVIGNQQNGTQVQLNYFTRTGTWQYNNWNEWVKISGAQANKMRKKYEDWLNSNGLLPENTNFNVENEDTLRWDSLTPDNLLTSKKNFAYGNIMIQFDKEENVSTFGYQMLWNDYIATEEIISPKKAYQQILEGNFEQYVPFQLNDKLFVESYEITYTYDTKGFYQPVYQFTGYINTPENIWVCSIPAIK